MNEEPTHKQSMPPLDTSTRLAYERTYLAHERTLMGWVRTAISLISFGFTIAKVFEYLHEKEGARAPLLGPRAVGIIMIATGLVALALATMQHRQASKVLHERCPDLPPSLSGVMAAFFALLGLLASVHKSLRLCDLCKELGFDCSDAHTVCEGWFGKLRPTLVWCSCAR